MKTNKIFKYKTYEDASTALKRSLNTDFDWESYNCIDLWLSEFIRGQKHDWEWMSFAINAIGHENQTIKNWFTVQNNNPSAWSKKEYKLIRHFFTII